jgi:diguanylate cyclase (GGDEF)-like protein
MPGALVSRREVGLHGATTPINRLAGNAAMNRSERLIHSAFDASRSGAFKWHIADGLVELSYGLLALLGLSDRDFDGRFDTIAAHMHPLDRERLMHFGTTPAPERTHFETELRFVGASDSVRWFAVQGELALDELDKPISATGIMQELAPEVVTERRMRTQQALLFRLLSEERIDTLPLDTALGRLTQSASQAMSAARASVWQLDASRGELICRDLYLARERRHESGLAIRAAEYPSYFEALAKSRAITVTHAPSDPRTRELDAGYLRPLGISSMLDSTIRRGGNTVGVVCIEHVGPMRHWSPDEQHFVASLADLATLLFETGERRELAARLERSAREDRLTGLPNRLRFREVLESGIRNQTPFLVMLIDLVEFRDVNHILGHALGDMVLVALAGRLDQLLPPGTTLCRYGGDKYSAMVPGIEAADAALALARSTLDAMREPLDVGGVRLTVNCRIGMSLFPAHGLDAEVLLREADLALTATRGVRGCRLYEPQRDRHSPRRLALMHDLMRAINGDAFSVLFQPRVELASGRVIGAEALARWQHPEFGAVAPLEFVALAELGDMIRDLTLEVLRRTAQAWHDLRAQGASVPLSINLSPYMLHDPKWADAIIDTLAAQGLPAQQLELEITENAFIHEPDEALQAMDRLCETGVRFSLDDFGIGYSSFEHLSRMPIHALKIDKLFVQGLERDPKCRAIVRSALLLGEELGLEVVAEGVESESTRSLLIDMGCKLAQGFLLGFPGAPQALVRH